MIVDNTFKSDAPVVKKLLHWFELQITCFKYYRKSGQKWVKADLGINFW